MSSAHVVPSGNNPVNSSIKTSDSFIDRVQPTKPNKKKKTVRFDTSKKGKRYIGTVSNDDAKERWYSNKEIEQKICIIKSTYKQIMTANAVGNRKEIDEQHFCLRGLESLKKSLQKEPGLRDMRKVYVDLILKSDQLKRGNIKNFINQPSSKSSNMPRQLSKNNSEYFKACKEQNEMLTMASSISKLATKRAIQLATSDAKEAVNTSVDRPTKKVSFSDSLVTESRRYEPENVVRRKKEIPRLTEGPRNSKPHIKLGWNNGMFRKYRNSS